MIGSPKANSNSGVRFNPPAQLNTVWVWLTIAAVIIVGSLIYIGISATSSDECEEMYCIVENQLEIPIGFELVSYVYEKQELTPELKNSELYDMKVSLSLINQSFDNQNLFLYGNDLNMGKWKQITTVSLSDDGYRASGVLSDPPQYLVLLRRLSTVGHVVAYLAPGDELNILGIEKTTIVHTLDFHPGPSGDVVGQLSFPKITGALHYPVIFVDESEGSSLANIDTILSSPIDRFNHVQSILRMVSQLSLSGIDIAYLDLDKQHRSSFTLFITELASGLHRQGKQLTLTLPAPKITARNPNQIDEGAYDWELLGQQADILKIWPIRDQSLYRLDVPIMLTYLTELIDRKKLVLILTPYASEKSLISIRSLTMLDAMEIATRLAIRSETIRAGEEIDLIGTNIDKDEGLSGILWQPETATVAFTYKLNGGRTIWLENIYSAIFKLEYVSIFRLGGVGIENGSETIIPNLWPPIIEFINSGQMELVQPNPETLKPKWWASGGVIMSNQRGGATWTAPSTPGKYRIALTISDGVDQFINDLTINIQELKKLQIRDSNE